MWAPNQWNIIAGEEAKIAAHLLDKNGDPLNIAGAIAIKMRIKLVDGSYLERQAETGFVWGRAVQPLYIYGFSFTPEETINFPTLLAQSVMLKVFYSDTNAYCYLVKKALNVEQLTL